MQSQSLASAPLSPMWKEGLGVRGITLWRVQHARPALDQYLETLARTSSPVIYFPFPRKSLIEA